MLPRSRFAPLLTIAAGAALLLLAAVVEAACPPLAVTLKVKPGASKATSAGKYVRIRATLKNTGSAALIQAGFGFYVPNGLCRIKASAASKLKAATTNGPLVGGNNVYWVGLNLGAGKRRRFTLKAQVAINLTAPTTLTVGAVGYVDGNNCTVEAAGGPRTLTVNSGATWGTHKAPKLSPQAQCGANPVVDPALPYSLYALNQRCAEAQLVPLGRRLAGEGASRRLPNEGYSKDDCYRACSRQNFIEPFYFELRGNDTEAQCYCCQKCERLYDSTSTIYQVNEAAPQYTLCGNGACVIPCESSVRRNRGRDRELGPPSRDEYAFGMNAYGDAGEYSTKDACAAACRASEDPVYTFMAYDYQNDVCYCSSACALYNENPIFGSDLEFFTLSPEASCPSQEVQADIQESCGFN